MCTRLPYLLVFSLEDDVPYKVRRGRRRIAHEISSGQHVEGAVDPLQARLATQHYQGLKQRRRHSCGRTRQREWAGTSGRSLTSHPAARLRSAASRGSWLNSAVVRIRAPARAPWLPSRRRPSAESAPRCRWGSSSGEEEIGCVAATSRRGGGAPESAAYRQHFRCVGIEARGPRKRQQLFLPTLPGSPRGCARIQPHRPSIEGVVLGKIDDRVRMMNIFERNASISPAATAPRDHPGRPAPQTRN